MWNRYLNSSQVMAKGVFKKASITLYDTRSREQ